MNEQEIRLIVRDAVRKHLGVPGPESRVQGSVPSPGSGPAVGPVSVQSPVSYVPETVAFGDHASHAMYMQLINVGGTCVIEEHVNCDHCGYCKSHGH